MTSPVRVRVAAPADLEDLLHLYVQLSPDNATTARDRAAAAFAALSRREGVSLLVAELDGRVAGTLTLVIVPNLTHDARPWAQLENMVVDATVRRLGVGKALMKRALDLAREAGCYKVQLQSANQRGAAHTFYEAEGYAPSSVGFRHYL